jgi:hypothetical protein
MRTILVTGILLFALAAGVLEAQSQSPSARETQDCMNQAETRFAELSVKVNQANGVHHNLITDDTEALAAQANDENTVIRTELVEQAKRKPWPDAMEAASASATPMPALLLNISRH